MFAYMDNSNMSFLTNIAARTGWYVRILRYMQTHAHLSHRLAIANTLFTVFLALKNTPLAWVTAWSYERLNILHQVAGYNAIIHAIIHGCTYAYYFMSENRAEMLRRPSDISGIVAGFAFLALGVSGAVVRRWWYELFYYLHVSFWAIGIVMVGLHQPEFSKGLIFVIFAIAGLWVIDRLVRIARLLLYSTNNSVILTPLPHGGTRVTLTKPPMAAKSGQHCFLWIPSIRTCETHPFTIASMDPPEFVVASYDGFTGDLHNRAISNPGVSLRASIEGSYGSIPNTSRFEKIIFVAGGSGASFTFGVALQTLKKMPPGHEKELVFIWFVKQRGKYFYLRIARVSLIDIGYIQWFMSQLQVLQGDSRVALQIFVTRGDESLGLSPGITSDSEAESISQTPVATSPTCAISADAEKALSLHVESKRVVGVHGNPVSTQDMPFTSGRPDISSMLREEITKTSTEKNVLVLGCGPDKLTAQLRNATASCIQQNGPGVELHCEQFGW